ncbi:DUF5979 domain-containing protein [Corynebacterium pseudotuberculosis]|uniref:DUF5979 domain-containing protein n=1 Tax=Corynebacterium pseudotuberculosis TaxID=1719 RepID=UPI001F378A87|nr:DUF5979 domain-containing protein [Corynebacterium pseudotuberculosis]
MKGKIQVKGNAQKAFISQQIPVGAKCKVTEQTDSAQIEGYSLKTTISPAEVTITNTEVDSVIGFEVVNQYQKIQVLSRLRSNWWVQMMSLSS